MPIFSHFLGSPLVLYPSRRSLESIECLTKVKNISQLLLLPLMLLSCEAPPKEKNREEEKEILWQINFLADARYVVRLLFGTLERNFSLAFDILCRATPMLLPSRAQI
jgi:hypothetical protein